MRVGACVPEMDGVADCDCEAVSDWLALADGLGVIDVDAVGVCERDRVWLVVEICVPVETCVTLAVPDWLRVEAGEDVAV